MKARSNSRYRKKPHRTVEVARPLVRQKLCILGPERSEVARQEIRKLLLAGFVREIAYPKWLSNIVMVKKTVDGWRMCVDFTNLNLACPKDSYTLLSINTLVDI